MAYNTSMDGVGLSHRVFGSVALYFHRLTIPGGAERMICQLAIALAERGFHVYLISWDPPDAQAFYPVPTTVTWIKLGFCPGIADKLRRTRALTRVLKDNDIHVLVGFVMSCDKTVYAAAKLSGVQLVAAERNAPAMYWLRYSRLQRWLCFTLLHLANRITVQMDSFSLGYPYTLRGRIETIPNPVTLPLHKARPEVANDAGRYTLLTVSRLDGVQKRIDCLIKAFARVAANHPAWDLRIIGDGPEQIKLHRLVTECAVANRVWIEPNVTNIFDTYTKAHLFAIPSLWEGFPNALAEALSHGLPAVGFAGAAGVADLIGNGGGGWLAEGLDDETTLAITLSQAMADGEERTKRGLLAAQSMATFTSELQLDRWVALLESLISEHAY